MDKFSVLDWFYKVKANPKEGAPLVIILVLAIFLIYKHGYSPKVKLLAREVRKLKGVQGQINQLHSATQNADEIALEIEEQKVKFERAKNLCYGKNDLTTFLRRIRELTSLSQIEIRGINPRPLTKKSIGGIEAEELGVSFNFKGDIVKLGFFLRLLEIEDKLTFLDLPDLVADENG